MSYRDLQNNFFQWILRDGLPVQVAIEYPSLQRKISDSQISGRLSRAGGHLLRMQRLEAMNGLMEKVVTMAFEGRDVNKGVRVGVLAWSSNACRP